MTFSKKVFFLLLVIFQPFFFLSAQTYETATSGSWDDAATWVGDAPGYTHGSDVTIIINSGHSVTIPTSPTGEILQFHDRCNLTVEGDLSINRDINPNENFSITINGNGAIELNGSIDEAHNNFTLTINNQGSFVLNNGFIKGQAWFSFILNDYASFITNNGDIINHSDITFNVSPNATASIDGDIQLHQNANIIIDGDLIADSVIGHTDGGNAITGSGNIYCPEIIGVNTDGFTGNINPSQPISITGSFSALNKTYDATTSATFAANNLELQGVDATHDVQLSNLVLAFETPNAGTNLTVNIIDAELTGLDADNYFLTLSNAPTAQADINKTDLQVTASSHNITYGDVVPQLSVSYNGFVANEDPTSLDNNSFSLSTTYIRYNDAGSYPVNLGIGSASDNNYNLILNNGAITVSKKALEVTASAPDISYGDPGPQVSLQYNGFVGSDNENDLTVTFTTGTNYNPGNSTGTYNTTISVNGTDTNYSITTQTGSFNVGKKDLQVRAVANDITYGDVPPAITFEYSGFYDTDNETVLDNTSFVTGSNYQQFDNAGTYSTTLTIGSATDNNYNFSSLLTSTFEVQKKELEVTADANDISFGAPEPEVTVLYNGFVNGENESNLVSTDFTLGTTYSQYDPAGTYRTEISPGSSSDINYQFTLLDSEFLVGKVTLNVTAVVNDAVNYGDPAPQVTIEYDGFINGDTEANIDDKGFIVGTNYTQGNDAGPYQTTIEIGTATDNNYDFNILTSNYDVGKRDLAVTATASDITYGENAPAISLSYGNFYGTDGVADLNNTNFEVQTIYTNNDDAGSYPVTINTGLASDNNYNFTPLTGSTFLVNKKELEVIASAPDFEYGSASPLITLTYNGFITGDNATMLDNTGFTTGTNYAQYDPVGTYNTEIGSGSATDNNYSFSPLTSTPFEVTQRLLTISANSFSKTEGVEYTFNGSYPSDDFNVNGLTGTDEVTSITIQSNGAPASAALGDHPINLSNAQGTGLSNYIISYNQGTLTVVEKITLDISGMVVDDKIYDGTTTAIVSNWGTLTGVATGDDVQLNNASASVAFNSPDAAEQKTINISGLTLSGSDAVKYELNIPSITANISKRDLVLTNFSADNKVYDGTNSVSGITFVDNRILGDDVSFSFDAAFVNKNVGNNKVVNISQIAVSGGSHANNYQLITTSASAGADITPRLLTFTDFVADNKVYDGTTSATGVAFNDNRVSGDNIDFSFDAEFENRHVGNNKTVSITNIQISGGADVNNYTPENTSGTATADITPKEITVGGTFSANDKIYDRTTEAVLNQNNLTLSGAETIDVVDLTNIEIQFSNRNAGQNIPVEIIDAELAGANAGNYLLSLSGAPAATANISTKALTITGNFTVENKSDDGTRSATIQENNLRVSGRELGDDATLTGVVAQFENADPGYNKTVSIISADLTGAQAFNYSITLLNAPTAQANIWAHPVAQDDERGTEFETPVTIDVLTNDTGLDNEPLQITIDQNPSEGTAIVNADNSITFTPAAGFDGVMTFNYRITDNDGNFDIATVTITVLPEGVTNHLPVAENDYAETFINTPITINVLANDTGLEDGFGSIEIISGPGNGTVQINANRTITYIPQSDFTGSDVFEYQISDVHGDNDRATVTINTIDQPIEVPVARDDARATEFETPVIIDLLQNDEGLGNTPVAVSISSAPTSGTADVNDDNTVTFTPANAFAGTVTFEYTVTDTNSASDVATVTVTVLEEGVINHIPVAENDQAETVMNTSVNINILNNDTGLEDGFGSIEIVSEPANGTVVINSNRTITYTPARWFVGTDALIYRLSDIHGDNDVAMVTITANDPGNTVISPTANPDSRATEYETPVTIDILNNDEGLANQPLAVTISSPSADGTTTITTDNKVTFTPGVGYSGTTSFEYTVTDASNESDMAVVTVIVLEEGMTNNIPAANNDQAQTLMNTPVSINLLANDSGLEDGFGSIQIVSSPANGVFSINPDRTITYTPNQWFVGTDELTYRVSDIHGDNDEATITINVIDPATIIPVANGLSLATEFETPVTIDVLANDEGLINTPVEVSISSLPTPEGQALVNPDNTVTFTPSSNFEGQVSFIYTVTDSNGASDNATINITVLPEGVENNIPVAEDDMAETLMNQSTDINVLANDGGLEDGFGSIQIVSLPANGSVEINENRTIKYTPAYMFIGQDAFEYSVSDIHGDHDIATVTVDVLDPASLNIKPIANPVSIATEFETPVDIDVLFNDEGLIYTPLSVSISLPSQDGNAIVTSDNKITFTPAAGFSGETTLEYSVTDANGNSDNAIVTVTVLPEGISNHIPEAVNDIAETWVNTPVVINILANDRVMEDGFGSLEIVSGPANGQVQINTNRTITYTPSYMFKGTDVLEYRLYDSHGDNDIATVTVTVREPEDIVVTPVANPEARATEFETPITIDVLMNDTRLDNTPITVSISNQSATEQGAALVNQNNTVTFTPAAGFDGTTSFEYTVTDANGASDAATVSITVLPEGVTNHIPVANNDETSTLMNHSTVIHVLGNDIIEDEFGSLELISNPLYGSVRVNSNRTVTYTPSYLFIGQESFIYRLSDEHGDNDVAVVTVTVTDPTETTPAANPESVASEFETPVTIDVLMNDTGLDNEPLTVSISSQPEAGQGGAVVNSDNTVTFNPASGFDGTTTFEYTVTDAYGASDNALVTVTVLPEGTINHQPEAIDDEATTYLNTTVKIDVLANDTGLDDGFGQLSIYQNPETGSVVVNDDNTINYTPANLFIGSETFIYRLQDVHGDWDIATVTVTTSDIENIVPVANNDEASVIENQSVNIDVLSNDTGLSDLPVSVTIAQQPENGTSQVENDNTITFTPDEDFTGETTFQYQVTDANGDNDVATVTVTVIKDNIPVANDDEAETVESTAVNISVLDNDTGLEDTPITVSISSASDNGVSVVENDNTITFTPNDGFSGETTFQYKITDADGDNDAAIVTITVSEENNTIPEAIDDVASTLENSPVNIDVLSNDTNLNDQPLVVSISLFPENGSVEVEDDNTVTFTPEDGFFGTTVFEYAIHDADGDKSTAVVTVNVIQKVRAINDTIEINKNQTITRNVLENDTGLGEKISVVILDHPKNGNCVLDEQGNITYDPHFDYAGSDLMSYRLCSNDDTDNCDDASVLIIINEIINKQPEDFKIPEGFSPDGDGVNDFFEIQGAENYDRITIRIFNRWGNLVFKSDNYQNNWNGNSPKILGSSGSLPTGAYFYIIRVVDNNKEYNGNVFLKK